MACVSTEEGAGGGNPSRFFDQPLQRRIFHKLEKDVSKKRRDLELKDISSKVRQRERPEVV